VAISHAVLALLTDGPCHGYQLRAAFEQAVGPQWGGLNIGHLYQVLDRLARDGQVSSALVPQSDRPDRRVYALTDAGRAELERWLAEPVERTGGYRDDLMLKLLAAARGGENEVVGVLDRQRRHELRRLKGLDQLARQHRDEPLVALLVEAATLHTKADLALLDRAETRAAALAAAAITPAVVEVPAPEGESAGSALAAAPDVADG
jgi:DNA-binding PadR family transcriptional regulator